jgi:23S rRNA pseudouridine1911/1915/1917 synthase
MQENQTTEQEEQSEDLYEKMVIKVDKGQALLRIDKFLMTKLTGATRNKLQRGIDNGFVLVNGKPVKANYKVHPEDDIILYTETHPLEMKLEPENIPLDIVYEDADVMVVNKKAGMVVHPGAGNHNGTLLNAVMYYYMQQGIDVEDESFTRLGLVHRIDKNTSGLLLLAKNEQASAHLSKQFFHHTVQREYVALVWGDVLEDEGTIDSFIARSQKNRKQYFAYPEGDVGKHAITHYKVIERLNYVTAVSCKLETGRTHQIRVHMKSIGHTLFNDDLYGGNEILAGTIFTKYKQFVHNCFEVCPRQALHAKTLGFEHPKTGKKMFFEVPIPVDFVSLWEKWRNYIKSKN